MLPADLQQLLISDPELRILFVEGTSDVTLWKLIVPIVTRQKGTVYAIDEIEVQVDSGGSKARALKLADISAQWPESDRLHYFVDSDFDRILGVAHPANVSTTDGRDIESYTLEPKVLECLCDIGAGGITHTAKEIAEKVDILLRPVSEVRVASATLNWALPFQKTLENGSLRRFFRQRQGKPELNRQALLQALASRAEIFVSDKEMIDKCDDAHVRLNALPTFAIIHGKDLIALLSWALALPLHVVQGLMVLSLKACFDAITTYPNIKKVRDWVEA